MAVRVFHRDEATTSMPMIASDARLVVWPGVGAYDANMNYVTMQPGEENVPHVHPTSEDTIFIVEGAGSVRDLTNDRELEFSAGQVIFVPEGVQHQVRASQGLAVQSIGGPCPADMDLLRRAGAVFAPRPAVEGGRP